MEEHIEYLQNLGLTEYQAKTMLVLFARHEATAEGICNYTGITDKKIYTVLKSLLEKGLITATFGKPRIFKCDEPTEVINYLIKRMATRIDLLKDSKREQLRKIRGMELQAISKPEKIHPMFGTEIAA